MKTNRYTYLLLVLLSISPSIYSFSQGVCASSALAPVFTQSFGTSSTSTTTKTVPVGFVTNYAFNNATALSDGQYLVTPLVQNSQKNDWAVGGDHTGDANGNMFLVNAGTGASLFFKQQVDNLCPGSTYSFSAWMANVNTASHTMPICNASYVYPNVSFLIKDTNGTVLQSFNTGNLPLTANRSVTPNWQQYGFQFSLPAGTTSLILEMVDYYGGLPQCGNDLAIDDITFSACTPLANISFNTANAICAGNSTTISCSLSNSPFTTPAYQWQKSTDGGNTWNNIGTAGTAASNISLSNVTTADGAVYRVLVGPDTGSLSSNTCITASNSLTLTVNPLPVVSAVNNGPICVGGTLQLTGNSSSGTSPYTYQWSGPSFSSSISNPTISNMQVTANAGLYTFNATDANGCKGSGNTTVIVHTPPTAALAGTDQVVCNAGTVALSGNTPITGYTGTWTQSGGPGSVSFTNPNQQNTQVNGLIPGTYTFTWTISNGVCSDSSDNVQVIVSPPTSAGTLSSGTTVCSSNNNGTVTLTGYTGNIIRWEFSTDGGTSWTVINHTLPSYTYQNLSSTTQFRSLVQSGPCAGQYSNVVTITVHTPTVGGIISADAVVCATSNSGILTLSGHTGSVLQWESFVNNGNSWTALSNTGSTQAYNNLSATTQYRATLQNGVCASAYSNTVTISVTPVTVPGILAGAATVCSGSNNGTLTLSGNTGDIVQWEFSVDGGQNWTVMTFNQQNYSYQHLQYTTTYRVKVQSGNCAAAYSNTITITAEKAAVAGVLSADASVCAGSNSGVLSQAGHTGNILRWEFSIDGGQNWQTIQQTSTTYQYQDLLQTTQFRTVLQNGICNAVFSTPVTITVQQPVTPANAGTDQLLCNSTQVVLEGNRALSGVGKWTITAGSAAVQFTNDTAVNTTVTGLTAGTYQFVWTITNAVCTDSRDTVSIVVYPYITNVIDTVQQPVCYGQSISLNGPMASGGNGTYQYQWEISYDGIVWNSIATANANGYTAIPNLSAYFRRVVRSSSCTSTSNTIRVIVLPTIARNTITGDQEICEGARLQQIGGNIPSGGDGVYLYQWQQKTRKDSSWQMIPKQNGQHLLLTNAPDSTTTYRRLVTSGNCDGALASVSNTVTVLVKKAPQATIQYKGAIFCKTNQVVPFYVSAATADSIRWDFGDGSVMTTLPENITHLYTKPGVFVPDIQLISRINGCINKLVVTDTIRMDEMKTGFTLAAVYDCGKTLYRFTDTSQSFFPVTNKIWTIDQSPMNGGKELDYIFTQAGSYEAALQLTNSYGCTQSLQARFTVNIYSYPKVGIDAIGQACLNNLMELKSVVNSVDSVKARLWNLGNGNIATDSVVQVSYFSEGKYIIKLTVATINSCYDSAVKQINIHPTPKISLSENQVLCLGDTLELKAAGASRYIWKDQNDSLLCTNCTVVKIVPKKNVQYRVIGYSEFGCSEIAATNVRVIQPLQLVAKNADSICVGQSKRLLVSGAGIYSWQPDPTLSSFSIANPVASPMVNTTYRVIGKDMYNCFADTATISIIVGDPTKITLGSDTTILSGVPVQLHASAEQKNIVKWQWKGNATFSCINCPTPTAKVIMDECLSCSATNVYGCITSDTVCIKTFCPQTEVFIPNAFSPDGDGINDLLMVQGSGIKLVKSFRIFSRWGELVFEKSNFSPGDRSAGWDGKIRGKAATPDVFVYVTEVICERGIPATFKGNVAILK